MSNSVTHLFTKMNNKIHCLKAIESANKWQIYGPLYLSWRRRFRSELLGIQKTKYLKNGEIFFFQIKDPEIKDYKWLEWNWSP